MGNMEDTREIAASTRMWRLRAATNLLGSELRALLPSNVATGVECANLAYDMMRMRIAGVATRYVLYYETSPGVRTPVTVSVSSTGRVTMVSGGVPRGEGVRSVTATAMRRAVLSQSRRWSQDQGEGYHGSLHSA